MTQLVHLVETLFALRGFEADPLPAGHVLRFQRRGQRVAVRVREARDALPGTVATEVADTLPAFGHAVLVCLGDVGHDARHALEAAGVDVWTRDKLLYEVGRSYVEAAENSQLPRTFAPLLTEPEPEAEAVGAAPAPPATLPPPALEAEVPPSISVPEPPGEEASIEASPLVIEAPASPPVPEPEPTPVVEGPARAPPPPALEPEPEPMPAMEVLPPPPAPVPVVSPPATPTFATLWTRASTPSQTRPTAAAKPAAVPAAALTPTLVQAVPPLPPAAAPAVAVTAAPSPAPPQPPQPGVLASTVDREAALKLGVGRLLRVDKASLELVPIHAFRYACRLETKGAPPIAKQGLIGVDAVSGNVREMPEPQFGALTERGERLQAMLPDLEASTMAKRRVVELHTQKLRVQNTLGRNSLIVEDKWVRPDPHSIQLMHEGLWWLPVWRLEGQNGMMRLNAATGAVEEEKLKKAFADSAEFL
jgi:hypothetical protein